MKKLLLAVVILFASAAVSHAQQPGAHYWERFDPEKEETIDCPDLNVHLPALMWHCPSQVKVGDHLVSARQVKWLSDKVELQEEKINYLSAVIMRLMERIEALEAKKK